MVKVMRLQYCIGHARQLRRAGGCLSRYVSDLWEAELCAEVDPPCMFFLLVAREWTDGRVGAVQEGGVVDENDRLVVACHL